MHFSPYLYHTLYIAYIIESRFTSVIQCKGLKLACYTQIDLFEMFTSVKFDNYGSQNALSVYINGKLLERRNW